jgi:hypothetical protein
MVGPGPADRKPIVEPTGKSRPDLAGSQPFSATSTSSSIFFASPNSIRLFSL